MNGVKEPDHIRTATITSVEQQELSGDHCVVFLLLKKGFKGMIYPCSPPVLHGELATWHDRVTGTYHYTQTLREDNETISNKIT